MLPLPGGSPALNKITPYNLGWRVLPGPWNGSWMQVIGNYETLSMDGDDQAGAALPGMATQDQQRVYYFVVWPTCS